MGEINTVLLQGIVGGGGPHLHRMAKENFFEKITFNLRKMREPAIGRLERRSY